MDNNTSLDAGSTKLSLNFVILARALCWQIL